MILSTLLSSLIGGNLAVSSPSSRMRTVGSCLVNPEVLMLYLFANYGNLVTFTCRNRIWGVLYRTEY